MIGFNWLHETEGQREGDNVGAPLVCMHLRSAMALRQKLMCYLPVVRPLENEHKLWPGGKRNPYDA